MANSFTTQTLLDGPRNLVVKLVGILDTSNLASTLAVDVSTFSGAPSLVRIDGIDYSIADQLAVQLYWDATTDVPIVNLAGREDVCYKEIGGLTNNGGTGVTGDILIQTTGWASGTQGFTIILSMVKTL